MKDAFSVDPVYRAALDARGLTSQFDAFLQKKDANTGEELELERSQDMFWRFMALFYQIGGLADRSSSSDIEIDEAGIDYFLVRSSVETGQPQGVKILRAVAETLVDFLGNNAGVFLANSSYKLVISTILREFAARSNLETDSSVRLLKTLMGTVAVAAADHGKEISEHPAATVLFNSLGRVRDSHGEDFVARIITHTGFTSVVSDWLADLATDPLMVDLVADLRGLDDGTYDPTDPTTLPANLQMVLGALTNTVTVIGDHIGSRDPLDREDRFRAVFAAALTGLSRNSTALLHQEFDGDRFMGSLLEAVISTIGRTGAIQNNDLIAPLFLGLLDNLSNVVANLGQDRTLSRAEEILEDFAERITSDGLQQTLAQVENLIGEKGARLLIAEVFAAARARGDIGADGDIERLHDIAELMFDEIPGLLTHGLDKDEVLRLVSRAMAQVSREDTADRSLIINLLPSLADLIEGLSTTRGHVDAGTIEAIYAVLLARFETDAPVWQDLQDAELAQTLIDTVRVVLTSDVVPPRIPTAILVQIAEVMLSKLSSHGITLGEVAGVADDPAQHLRDLTASVLNQAVRSAFEQLGRNAGGNDMPIIIDRLLGRSLAGDTPAPLADAELADAVQAIMGDLG
ncbi:hypothetical protein ROA7450_03864 [Roseovarius albus]|uniref:Uncharacterized protein n=1 Tax=Roseovarius albus TaxID=1247867 RepID=A0A1X7A4Y1_9RHOB|nr:hypothetical protein [Roseovarius albus]SLN70816.1 hypothetical protein ROA7450_03864 [Roseovarius albus]